MFLRQIYDDVLAQSAYLIGCQQTGEAILVDPQRDIDRYTEIAAREQLRIVAVTETHIHADYLSATREVASRLGARVYLSSAGGEDWSYRWPAPDDSTIDAVMLDHEQQFMIGNIEFTTLLTPGHTPEHVCFLVTDRGSDADGPMGLLSGDFLFVGDVGRPDLLETAAGIAGAREPSARMLYESLKILDGLSEYLQIWPGHGSGSACGKSLGAVLQSTLGYERRFNPALRAHGQGEEAFLAYVLTGQPEPPLYFARMKTENRDGPAMLMELPRPTQLGATDLADLDMSAMCVLDVRPWKTFRESHLPGAVWSTINSVLPTVVGSFCDPMQPITIVAEPKQVEHVVRCLVRIGYDRIEHFVTPGTMEEFSPQGKTSTIREISVEEIDLESTVVLDVRRAMEFDNGHIDGALNIAHTRLRTRLDELPRDKPIVVHCQTGIRSGAACSMLEAEGFDVRNLSGGVVGWIASGKPVQMAAQSM